MVITAGSWTAPYQGLTPTEDSSAYIDSCLDITDRKVSEQALTEQLKFQTMLGELLTAFISLTPGRLDSQIKEVQKRICETLGLDRSMLAQLPVEGDDLLITHSWAAEGFSVAGPLSRRHLPWTVRTMMSGQPIRIARIDDLPEEAAIDKETLRQSGLKSRWCFRSWPGENDRGTGI